MRTTSLEMVVVGAGPYGLSIAAHLRAREIPFRIFGPPMQTWRQHMPKGMLLKSDGFASNLSDPQAELSLKNYCASRDIPYADRRVPVELKTFVDYGMAFQQRFAQDLDVRSVAAIERASDDFHIRLEDGETLRSKRVLLAVGISHFAHIPDSLSALPAELLSHSSRHNDLEQFRSRNVTVIGAGASAIDLAALLYESGAEVNILARRKTIDFHELGPEHRSVWERLRRPSSGLGPGWKSRFCTEAPAVFRRFPEQLRVEIVRRHLGPAPGWPMKARVAGKVPMQLGIGNLQAETRNGNALLTFVAANGQTVTQHTDHVIAATGYRPDLQRLTLLHGDLLAKLKSVANSPLLSAGFQSSVPGLYFVGLAAANSFGPMMRFAFGADYTARQVVNHVARAIRN